MADFNLQQAIQSAPITRGPGYPIDFPYGETVHVGAGVVVDRPVILRGNGCTVTLDEGATAFKFTREAKRSTMEDLLIAGPGKNKPSIGIDVAAHGLRLRNLHLQHLTTGIQMISGKELPDINCNLQKWSDIWITQCQVGIYIKGRDCNAGLFTAISIQSVDVPVMDGSFLGNTWIAPSSHAGRAPEVPAMQFPSQAAYPVLIAPYLEGKDTLDMRGVHGLVVGGNGVSSMTDGSTSERIGMGRAVLQFMRNGGARIRVPGVGLQRAIDFMFPGGQTWSLMQWVDGKMGLSRNGASKSPYRWDAEGRYELGEPVPPKPVPPKPVPPKP